MSSLMLEHLGPQAMPQSESADDARFNIEVVDKVDAGWDAVVTKFADLCLEQTAAFMMTRWGSSRLSGIILRDVVTAEPEAAALAVIAALPIVKLGLAYVKFGPLWRRNDKPVRPRLLSAALGALQREFAKARGLLVRVMPPADPDFSAEWERRTRQEGFVPYRMAESPNRYLVDLTLNEKEQLMSLGSKWRANLRKAHASELEIREVDPIAQLPAFMGLYGAMSSRKQFLDHHHVEQLPEFVRAASGTLNVRMFLASAAGQPVAGTIIAGSGERVIAPFSASNQDALPVRAGFALRWAIINTLRGSRAKWLDLGGDEGDSGLRHFKEGNVGSRGRIVSIPGEFDYAGSALSSAATAAIGWAHSLSRTRPLQSLRSGD
jgi:hypothetical protein